MEIIYKDWRSALIWLSPSSFLKEVFEDGAFNLLSIDFPIGDMYISKYTYIHKPGLRPLTNNEKESIALFFSFHRTASTYDA